MNPLPNAKRELWYSNGSVNTNPPPDVADAIGGDETRFVWYCVVEYLIITIPEPPFPELPDVLPLPPWYVVPPPPEPVLFAALPPFTPVVPFAPFEYVIPSFAEL